MKIAHIFWALGFGGIETMLVNIANAQASYECRLDDTDGSCNENRRQEYEI